MAESWQCLTDAESQALISGTLSAEEHQTVATHLESCESCRLRLQELTDETSFDLAEVNFGSKLEQPSEALEIAMRNLKAATADTPGSTVVQDSGQFSLHFLRPSTNPRHLGMLDGYEILDVIGRGGMGTVLKARDTKLERLVAVKVLDPALASSNAARARFLREARAAAAVAHDHVVTIHAVDDSGEVPYLVMEYIVGVSLEDHIQQAGHLPLEQVLRIGMQVSTGLAAAHAHGLVHRDIKPANILLENSVERVKITDFGLVRVIHDAQLSQTDGVSGTPQYMSPEQACGESVDHRSDLFSLGCLMYAMCTGRSPFRADTPTGVILRVCKDTPRSIREVNPDIPEWLVTIIDRLLAKKPEDRFQTASEVAELLEQYLSHVQEPSRTRLSSIAVGPGADRRGVFSFRRRAVVIAATVGTLLLGLASMIVLAAVTGTRPHFTLWTVQEKNSPAEQIHVDSGTLPDSARSTKTPGSSKQPGSKPDKEEPAPAIAEGRLYVILDGDMGDPCVSASPYAVSGQWQLIAEQVSRFLKENPDSLGHYRPLAVAQLMAGDVQGYKKTCAEILRRRSQFGPVTKSYMVQACCLSADCGVVQEKLAGLLREVDASEVSKYTYGMATEFYLFRSGRDEEVLAAFVRCKIPYRDACILLFRAMASHRLGRNEDAKELLAQAIVRIEQDCPSLADPTKPDAARRWVNWGTLQILLREAQQMIASEQEVAIGVSDTKPTSQAGL